MKKWWQDTETFPLVLPMWVSRHTLGQIDPCESIVIFCLLFAVGHSEEQSRVVASE